MREILIATSNLGKLRDFAAAATNFQVSVAAVPGMASIPPAREDAPSFEANACKKAEHYSRLAKGRYVLADDSGLEVDALNGAPGVLSARYARERTATPGNSTDAENNARLLANLQDVPEERRTAKFVCCIAVGRDGRTVICFRGEVKGIMLREPRGTNGFGYDPLFYVRERDRTFAELSSLEKAEISHRGLAFRKFLRWFAALLEETLTGTNSQAKLAPDAA